MQLPEDDLPHPALAHAGDRERIPFLAGANDVIAHHHERFDGGGYPDGLASEDIPLAARIFSVVDAYDAMVSKRCYKEARPASEAVAELQRCAGTQFDPRVVDAFVGIVPHIEADKEQLEARILAKIEMYGLGRVEDRTATAERMSRSA